jgi:hypothetical protein
MFVHVTIRWQYAYNSHWKEASKKLIFCISFTLSLCHAEGLWNKDYDANYWCRLLTTFRVVPKAVYGLLATIRKVANTSCIT